jgi:hypothetical protein
MLSLGCLIIACYEDGVTAAKDSEDLLDILIAAFKARSRRRPPIRTDLNHGLLAKQTLQLPGGD